ncbi:hypothetical protein O0B21_11745, partial [Staphylococcus pseudintermedius]|nr:hypothetical protein [Staphylococcus pseudintermedius]
IFKISDKTCGKWRGITMQFWLKFICFIIASILIAHFIWNEMRIASLIISIITLIAFSIIEYVFKKKEKE